MLSGYGRPTTVNKVITEGVDGYVGLSIATAFAGMVRQPSKHMETRQAIPPSAFLSSPAQPYNGAEATLIMRSIPARVFSSVVASRR